jgi:NIMA (never in mitosis gene a)-related kinase
VWKDEPYSKKCDIWSLGCVIYELTSLKPPFLAKNMADLHAKVVKGEYPRLPKHFSNDLAEVIGFCLTLDPKKRYSAEELLSLPQFGPIDQVIK